VTQPTPRLPLDWLAGQPGFRDLAAHARRLAELQTAVDRCAPIGGLVVTSLEGGTLVLTTRAAAWAAKLRQFEPSLVASLTAGGWQVSRIKIRPQPQRAHDEPVLRGVEPKPPVPEAALVAMADLAGRTQGALSAALSRLVRNQRRGR
jgi:hypothetical protein